MAAHHTAGPQWVAQSTEDPTSGERCLSFLRMCCRLNKHAVKVELEGPSQEHHNTVKFKLVWVECLPEKFQDDPHSSALTSLKATAVESLSNDLSKKILEMDINK